MFALSVYLFAMSGSDDNYDQLLVIDFIENAIITNTDTVGSVAGEFLASRGSWVISKGKDVSIYSL